MKKLYQIFEEFHKESLKRPEKPILDLFKEIFSNKTIDISVRLMESSLSNKYLEQVIEEVEKREKSRCDEKFYSFQVYADGIYLSKFDDNDNLKVSYLVDLPVSTALLELIGESYTGESVPLSCFVVPNIYDPDLSDCDLEHRIRHKNLEILAEFSFSEYECLKVHLEVTKLLPYLISLEEEFNIFNSESECEVLFTQDRADTSTPVLDSFTQIFSDRRLIFEEPSIALAKIKIIGVGGAGGNAVNRMIEAGITGVDFIVANTDVQALANSKASIKIQLGSKLTQGLGAGSSPTIGRDAAIEDNQKILDFLVGADMVFVAAGLGGGTGTGAAPVIGSLAKSLGILTIGVVTTPFTVEGKKRIAQAEQGLTELRKSVDTVITIPNSKLCEFGEKVSIINAFRRADDVLLQAVRGISSLITTPGIINLDFADIRTVVKNRGTALVGFGEATGERAAVNAMNSAIQSRFLEDYSIKGATGILTNFSCSKSTPINDIEEAFSMIEKNSNDNADIFLGTTFNSYENYVQLMFIATGDFAFSEKSLPQSIKTKAMQYDDNNPYCFQIEAENKGRLNLLP